MNQNLQTRIRWDRAAIPAHEEGSRYLLLEVEASRSEDAPPREPLNLALAIDTSGSMAGAPVEAAKRAALQVIETLGAGDRLSLIHFSSQAASLFEGMLMDPEGRRRAMQIVGSLRAGGGTDLSGGWFEAARCVSEVIDREEATSGRILMISDGFANRGITDPAELLHHAREIARRGVITSALGIGDGYSPLQLDALAEGGGGRLHDAATPEETYRLILAELGEMRAVVASQLTVRIEAEEAQFESVNDAPVGPQPGSFFLGELTESETRPLALHLRWPASPPGTRRSVRLSLSWIAPGEESTRTETFTQELPVVSAAELDAIAPDLEVRARIADLKEAAVAYQSMRDNENRDYAMAQERYRAAQAQHSELLQSLPDAEERRERFARQQERVSRAWHGRSKLDAYVQSKKSMKGEWMFEERERARREREDRGSGLGS